MELMVDFVSSLDGYGAAEGWPGFWSLEGPEYLAWLAEDSAAERTILMGANTYRLMSALAGSDAEGAGALDATPKIVFSSTLREPLSWANTRLIDAEAVEVVRELKATGQRPLVTLGSLTLCRALLSAGLVDRFRVVVFSVITGTTGHDRIYDGYPDAALDLAETRTFDRGIILLDYRPRLLDAPLPPGLLSHR